MALDVGANQGFYTYFLGSKKCMHLKYVTVIFWHCSTGKCFIHPSFALGIRQSSQFNLAEEASSYSAGAAALMVVVGVVLAPVHH
jgi:hypothetical protein